MNAFVKMTVAASVLASALSAFADEIPQPASYTYVDCHQGDDSKGVPFDETKPYHTLKAGVEKTIEYINNVHPDYLQPNNVTLEIRLKSGCVFNSYDQGVSLAFSPLPGTEGVGGMGIANRLLIRSSIPGKAFGVENTYFTDPNNNAWGVIFANADFLSGSSGNGGAIFQTNSQKGIRIKDSAISTSGGITNQSKCVQSSYSCGFWGCVYLGCGVYNSSNVGIENSYVLVNGVAGDNYLNVPGYISNSKIDFVLPEGQSGRLVINASRSSFNLLRSSIVDLHGQDLRVETDTLNTKFENVRSFTASEGFLPFVNNTVDTPSEFVSSTGWPYAYNNVFPGGFSDPVGDVRKSHRNGTTEQSTGGVGWRYMKGMGSFLETNISDRYVYAETHSGQTIPENFSPIFVTFQ